MLKSFAQAKLFAPQIDDKILTKAADFLISKQDNDGSFNESGRVIHQDMQGGVESKQSITAYGKNIFFKLLELKNILITKILSIFKVLIALIESALMDNNNIQHSIDKGIKYLEKEVPKIQDVYTLGLVAYVLNIGLSDIGKQYYTVFQSKSIRTSSGNIYWSKTPQTESSSDIELSSYGLLLNLYRNDLANSLSIVRYLISKSNSLGSYSNTQNTVLGLQALSEFGIKTISKTNNAASENTKYNVNINVGLIDKNDTLVLSNNFVTNDQNAIVLQTWDLPSCNYKVRV